MFLVVLVRCAWIFAAPLRSADLPLRLAQDDFYYYLKVAQNLAWFHRATFDGSTLTNGYHPLYFLLLTIVSRFVHTLPGIFRFLWGLDLVSAMTIFVLTRRLFKRVSQPLLANALAVFLTALSVTQICDQMEVTLALPLAFAFLLTALVSASQITGRRSLLLGLLSALTFLARLDAGLLVLCYLVAALCTREYRRAFTPGNIGKFFAACLPLPLVYFWINHHYFHTFLPISGMAKQLRHGWKPCILLPGSFNGMSEVLAFGTVATAVLAWTLRRYLLTREKIFLVAVLATPFLFYGLEMLISDWPVWNWYFYVLRFSAAGMAMLVAVFLSRDVLPARYPRLKSVAESAGFAVALGVAMLVKLYMANYKVDHWMVEVQHASGILDQFAQSHPGLYAMGDRAGMFAITTPNRVLQTEGLVMDRRYLEHIRRQEDLRSVLSSYGVNYYVAFVFDRNYETQLGPQCFHALEPSIAGPSALRMRTDFCEAPLLEFPGSDGKYLIYRIEPHSSPSPRG